LKIGFEVIGGEIAERGMPSFGVVISEVAADLHPGFREVVKVAAGE
jgi:hypothetical protein